MRPFPSSKVGVSSMYSMEASSLASPCYELEDEIEGSGYLCLSSFYFLVYCYDLCPFTLEGESNT